MNNLDASDTGRTIFSGALWYQQTYFHSALQQEIDRARDAGTALCLVVLRLPDYTRKAARQLFAYAESEDGRSFFGILANGDYAIAMPGGGFTEGAQLRVNLSHELVEFDVCSGLAVLDAEETAEELLQVAATECSCAGTRHFDAVQVA